MKRYSINLPILAALTVAARHLSRVITRAAGSRYVPTAPLLTCGTRAARRYRAAHVRIVPPTRLTWRVMTLDAWTREASLIADSRREARAAHAASLITWTGHPTCATCHAPVSLGSVCDHAGYVPRETSHAARTASRLTHEARTLIRIMRDAVARERASESLARENGTANRERVTWEARNASRASKARARYLASLTPEQRTALDALNASTCDAVDRIAERVTPRASWDAEAARGITSAREARVTQRGTSGKPQHARAHRSHAARVTTRDTLAPTMTLAPMESVGYSTHPALTREQHAALLDAVLTDPSRATLTRSMPGPHGRMVTRGVPVTGYTRARDEAREAQRAERAQRIARARARVQHATRHVIADDEGHAARYARLSRAGIAGTLDA